MKIDRKFTEKDSAFLRYSQGHDIFSQPGSWRLLWWATSSAGLRGPCVSGRAQRDACLLAHDRQHGALRLDSLLCLRQELGRGPATCLTLQPQIPGVINPNNPLSDGLPVITFIGAYTAIGDAGNSPTNIGTNNYQVDDDLTLVRGKHSLDLGFD